MLRSSRSHGTCNLTRAVNLQLDSRPKSGCLAHGDLMREFQITIGSDLGSRFRSREFYRVSVEFRSQTKHCMQIVDLMGEVLEKNPVRF